MKKFLYTALMLLSSVALVTSCDDDDNSAVVSQTPAVDVAGTYNATWNVSIYDSESGETTENTYSGTVVLSENEESKYVVNIEADCPDISMSKSGAANIATTSANYTFINKSADESNAFGSSLLGSVTGQNLSMKFVIETSTKKIVNKKPKIITITNTYTITGTKQ